MDVTLSCKFTQVLSSGKYSTLFLFTQEIKCVPVNHEGLGEGNPRGREESQVTLPVVSCYGSRIISERYEVTPNFLFGF